MIEYVFFYFNSINYLSVEVDGSLFLGDIGTCRELNTTSDEIEAVEEKTRYIVLINIGIIIQRI